MIISFFFYKYIFKAPLAKKLEEAIRAIQRHEKDIVNTNNHILNLHDDLEERQKDLLVNTGKIMTFLSEGNTLRKFAFDPTNQRSNEVFGTGTGGIGL